MMFGDEMLGWLERLTGLEPARVDAALERVEGWGIEHVAREILSVASIDNAVAATFLSEAVEALVRVGTPEAKLLSKLQGDREFWPTWAELRAAARLIAATDSKYSFHLEPSTRGGKHADFQFTMPGCQPLTIEFKAIGLSDEEAAFCSRVAPALELLLPPRGLLTFHTRLTQARIPVDSARLQEFHDNAAAFAHGVSDYPAGLSGVTIVGHHGEANYTRRVLLRLQNEIMSQLPDGEQGWAAFHWTNGAPIRTMLARLKWDDLPRNLAGLIFVGDAVAFPSRNIHSYLLILPRDAKKDSDNVFVSTEEKLATVVFDRLEASSGVRPTLLTGMKGRDKVEILRRDGRRRILPFNLLMDRDPHGRDTPDRRRNASPV